MSNLNRPILQLSDPPGDIGPASSQAPPSGQHLTNTTENSLHHQLLLPPKKPPRLNSSSSKAQQVTLTPRARTSTTLEASPPHRPGDVFAAATENTSGSGNQNKQLSSKLSSKGNVRIERVILHQQTIFFKS